jgi:catechol 2,3-dioxygenase-like lactoylglutathione lyase family enzyme
VSVKARYSTPMFHVTDVARSIAFYEQLGFEVVSTEGDCGHIGWARLGCEGGAIMLLEAEPPHATQRGVLLYMYTVDLAGLREQLLARGIAASEITHPGYMLSGEMRVEDPDGYVVLVGHWGRAEHEAWEQRIAEKRKAQVT